MDKEITLGDLEDVLKHINKCMHAYKFWDAKYKNHIKSLKESGIKIEQDQIEKLQKNYDNVMNALIICFDFIENCDHILKDYKDTLLFGVIYVSTKDVETDNFELIKRIEKYRKWFLDRS